MIRKISRLSSATTHCASASSWSPLCWLTTPCVLSHFEPCGNALLIPSCSWSVSRFRGSGYLKENVTIQDQCMEINESSCLHVRGFDFHTFDPNRAPLPIWAFLALPKARKNTECSKCECRERMSWIVKRKRKNIDWWIDEGEPEISGSPLFPLFPLSPLFRGAHGCDGAAGHLGLSPFSSFQGCYRRHYKSVSIFSGGTISAELRMPDFLEEEGDTECRTVWR